MIRLITKQDKSSIIEYLSKKLVISEQQAALKTNKLINRGLPFFIKELKNIEGICWVEHLTIDEKKVRKLFFLVDNWRLAEDLIKLLRWNLNGDYVIEIPKHDFLNRTLNKNGFRFSHIKDNYNVYNYRFEKRTFHNSKLEDND